VLKLDQSKKNSHLQTAPAAIDGDDSFDDDLGPNFGSIPHLPGSGGNVDQMKRALH